MGRDEVKMNVGVSRQPSVMLGLMGVKVVEDDMKLAVQKSRGDAVHKVEKLDAATAF